MKQDLTTCNEDTLMSLKQRMIVELETFCNEKLADTISTSDLQFFFDGIHIIETEETMTLDNFVNKVPTLLILHATSYYILIQA